MAKRLRATLVNFTHPTNPRAKINCTALIARGFQADVLVLPREPKTFQEKEDFLVFLACLSNSQIGKVIYGR